MNSNKDNGMSLIVKVITRLTVGLIFIYGIYISLHGHLSPGGGFAGGVIVALSFVHLVLAFGREELFQIIPKWFISLMEGFAAVAFLTLSLIGFSKGYFFYDWFASKGQTFSLFSSGAIPLYNIIIEFKVSFGLFAIFIALILLKLGKSER